MKKKLEKAILGRTGLEVTRLGFGSGEIRGSRMWGGRPVGEKQAEALLNKVLDSGINFIDTANCYGRAEEFIGKYISHRRSEFFIATKCGCLQKRVDETTDQAEHVWTRENLFRGLEESLGRLKTDYVDLMQFHNATPEQCEEGGLIEALEEMRDAGKVRWVGISTTLPFLPTFLKQGRFATFQIPYSALERKHEDCITQAAEANIGTIVRGGAARGEGATAWGSDARWKTFGEARLDDLREEGEGRTAFVLRFTLSHPDLHTNIVATLNPDHLEENLRTARKGPLPPDVYEEAKRRLKEAGVEPQECSAPGATC